MNHDQESNEEVRNESPQNKEDKIQEEMNEKGDDEEIPIVHIMKKIIEIMSKSQDKYTQVKAREVVSLNEETESNKKSAVKIMKSISKSMTKGVKENKKIVPPQNSLKSVTIVLNKALQSHLLLRKERLNRNNIRKGL